MTESEAKGFIQGKLDCMEKCDVFNKEDKHRNNECELCEYCYSQGTFREQKEAFSMAINALEKQIPKKPIIKQSKYCNAYHCPVCNGYIRSTNTRIEVILEENIFCSVCGQKLDWSDEE